jgi:hypothetical protein
MKKNHLPTLVTGLCLTSITMLGAAGFDSGSDGSYGPLNITTSTNIDVPADGIFRCTTINIEGAATSITFNPNPRNTPIYLLATGDVVISATIHINGGNYSHSNPGRGGPGGFDGGFGTVQGYASSDGQGPGAGSVAAYPGAVFATPIGQNSNVYGNTLLVPLVGGSGGTGYTSGQYGGGGGGGAIAIASNSRITINSANDYNIRAEGGNGVCGGSGGAVRLVAPVVNGNGRFYVSGGGTSYPGGGGRIRIDTLDRYAWRNLGLIGGKWTIGSQMYVFPPNNPRLDIVEAAAQTIAEGANAVVNVSLAPGSSTNQVIKVKATGFTTDVPVTVSVVPEAGPSFRYNGLISVTGPNPVIGNIAVVIPIDSFCNVRVWTR